MWLQLPWYSPNVRDVSHVYEDPLDHIWLRAARRVGLRVHRADDAYAATDGRGGLAIATRHALDADDCLAQMIFHELCHSLVEGHDGLEKPDWGLDNMTDRDVPREHACLRAQAALAAPHGLRAFLAPTTDFRGFYDALPADPLDPPTDETSILARAALVRARARPWAPALGDALAATAAVVAAAADGAEPPSLLATVEPAWPKNGVGLPQPPYLAGQSCAGCAWRYRGGPGRAVDRCRQADGARVDPAWAACERFEPALDCCACGACCREAYGSVTIGRREPIVRAHSELVVDRGDYLELARVGPDGERCAALEGRLGAYTCRVYELRPAPCRDLENAGEHCLTARRRVGLSR